MLGYSLWALAGAWSLQLASRLPPGGLLPFALAAALVLVWPRRLRWAGCGLLGACIVWLAAGRVLDDRLPRAFEGDALAVAGSVLDFTDARANPLRFVLAVRDAPELPSRIRVSWYDAPVVPQIGETWRLDLKLSRPRGFANPLHFDYEHWLFRQRIGATGYVLQGPANARVTEEPVDALSELRARLAARLLDRLGQDSATAVLLAVTVGATHEITRAEWDRYAVTGTSHLMAISGMNIAMAAGGAYLLAWLLAAPFCRRANARDIAACIAAATAIAYSEISGFAIPVQRAMLMALLVLAAALLRRQVRGGRLLAITCIAVVALDPLAVHAPGFKLSFAAVAILIWSARRRRMAAPPGTGLPRRIGGALCALATLQLELLLGLLPLTALLFGRVAWLAPLVNLLVVPLFELLTVPAALLGLLLAGPLAAAGDALLLLAWQSVRVMLYVIDFAARLPYAHADIALLPPALLPVAWLPALWAVLPPGFPGRRLAWAAAAALVLYRPSAAPPGCVDVAVLDVGQGLSVVARTSGHTLVYDTGPSFRSGSDTGALVVVPYLRAHGISRIDRLVVSHGDSDHAGGARSVLRELPVGAVYVGERLPLDTPQRRCRAGQGWTWDGVRFDTLHPAAGDASGNDASCVLQIAAGTRRVLFTGDIESAAERRLLQAGALRAAGLVIVPHHGSRTSSGAAFVARLHPGEAIVSAGYRNRWGMPKEDVVRRWQGAGARVLNTATAGEIEYRVCPATGAVLTHRHRVDARRYWLE